MKNVVVIMLAKTYDNIKATITIDREDWHIVCKKENVTHVDKPLIPGLSHYSTVLAGKLLPIYREIGQDNLIKAHKNDPKNGIRNLLHEYLLKRKERETNHE